MAQREYLRLIDDKNRIRIKFETEHGRVRKFSIQYELKLIDEWKAIVRYDTSHGFAHRDILMPDGSQKKESFDVGDFGSTLTFAQEDLLRNWENYRENYLQRMKK